MASGDATWRFSAARELLRGPSARWRAARRRGVSSVRPSSSRGPLVLRRAAHLGKSPRKEVQTAEFNGLRGRVPKRIIERNAPARASYTSREVACKFRLCQHPRSGRVGYGSGRPRRASSPASGKRAAKLNPSLVQVRLSGLRGCGPTPHSTGQPTVGFAAGVLPVISNVRSCEAHGG